MTNLDSNLPRWKQRFLAPSTSLPNWAVEAPERLIYSSNESGAWQVHIWDRATGRHERITDHPTGVVGGVLTPDGKGVAWFDDGRGDEIGHWRVRPFDGGEVTDLLPGLAPAWSAGLALAPGGHVAVGIASRDGFVIHVGTLGEPTRQLYVHDQMAGVGGISRDGRIVLVSHAEHGDNLHPALRAFDRETGDVIDDLWDGEGFGVFPAAVSPVAGDPRIAIERDRTGRVRPAIWDPVGGNVTDLKVHLPGEVEVADWWPDASALLLVHNYMGRDELYRADLASGLLGRIEHPTGSISGARVRPDGTVWYRISSGAEAPVIRSITEAGLPSSQSGLVMEPPGNPAPPGVTYRSWTFPNPAGQVVHGFVAEPEGQGPHPAILLIHGGPTAQDADAFSPQVQAFVDHGFVVAQVNYRGSTGYGKDWQDLLEGDPGRPEVEDITAGRDDLIKAGIADPERIVIAGASWGGYITLQTIGTVPDGWRAALAVVPVADYVAAYEDESEGLQAYDRGLFGGSPADKPDLYVERSPITYAEQVKTPVLLMVGENDTRCPLRQVLNYAERLEKLGKVYELDRFDAGHGALVIDERVRQTELLLDFLARHIPGAAKPIN